MLSLVLLLLFPPQSLHPCLPQPLLLLGAHLLLILPLLLLLLFLSLSALLVLLLPPRLRLVGRLRQCLLPRLVLLFVLIHLLLLLRCLLLLVHISFLALPPLSVRLDSRLLPPHAEEDEDVIVCLHQEPQQHPQIFRGPGGRGGETRAVPHGPTGASLNFHRHNSSQPSPLSISQNGLSKDSSPAPTTTAKAVTPTSHVHPAPLAACSPALSNPSEKKPLSSSSLSSSTLRRNEAPREERSQGTLGVSTSTQSSSPGNSTRPAGLSQSSPSKNTAISSVASPNKLTGVQDDEGGKGRGGGGEEEGLTTSSSSKKLREQRHGGGGGVPRKRKLDGSQASSATSSRNLPLLLLLQAGRFGGGDGGDYGNSMSTNAGFSPPGITDRREEETNRSATPSTSSSPSVPSCNNTHAPTHSPSSPTPQSSSDSPPLEGQCEVFEGEEGMDVRFTVRALQSNLKCRLCGGFFREAVTIKDCLHTFCKWCLYIRAARQDLEETGCPRCEEKLRHSLPHTNGKKPG